MPSLGGDGRPKFVPSWACNDSTEFPLAAQPDSGANVRYPLDDMLGILALESWRHRCLIVGEDLGTLPEGFRERMAETKLLSYRLMKFERYPDGLFRRPSTYRQAAVATFGTHDSPTVRSWREGGMSSSVMRLA